MRESAKSRYWSDDAASRQAAESKRIESRKNFHSASGENFPAQESAETCSAEIESVCPYVSVALPSPGVVHSLSLAMPDDGNLRGQGQFPATRWSLIVAARECGAGRTATRA